MYIYQTLPCGIPAGPDWENLTEGMRIIEVDGHPAPLVGIKYRAGAKALPSSQPQMDAARVSSGQLAGPGPQSAHPVSSTYWADRPSGGCGGQRLRSTLAEDLAVSHFEACTYCGSMRYAMCSS